MIEYLKSRFLKSNYNNPNAYEQAMVAAGHFVLAVWAGWLIGVWLYIAVYVIKEALDVWRSNGRAWLDSATDIACSGLGLVLVSYIGFEAWACLSGVMIVMAAYFIKDFRAQAARGE